MPRTQRRILFWRIGEGPILQKPQAFLAAKYPQIWPENFFFAGTSPVNLTGSSTGKEKIFSPWPLCLRGESKQFSALLNKRQRSRRGQPGQGGCKAAKVQGKLDKFSSVELI